MADTTPAQAAQPEEARRRVAEVARQQPGRAAARQRDETVFVWPNLLIIEFIAALVIMLLLMVLSWLVNAPLEAHANPDRTPNPSKAPWYFLNLQELLLHMNPALAGVIVPTLALVALAAIPYVDKGSKGLGVWFYSKRGPRIMLVSTIYTLVCEALLIALDKYVKLKDQFQSMIDERGPLSG